MSKQRKPDFQYITETTDSRGSTTHSYITKTIEDASVIIKYFADSGYAYEVKGHNNLVTVNVTIG